MTLSSDLQPLWNGLITTSQFFGLTLILSIPLGLAVAILARRFPKTIGILTRAYVYLFRGTPLLLQMMFVFFGLPFIGVLFGRFEAALVTLVLNYGAYFAEIFRGGLQAIPKGQYEAIQVLSINEWKGLRKIILPQLWRTVMPSVGNEVISLIKDTSLIHVLGLEELLKVGRTMSNQQASLLPFVYVGIIYLIFTGITSWILNNIEMSLKDE